MTGPTAVTSNVVGNVLGRTETSAIYECNISAQIDCDLFSPNIFRLGYASEFNDVNPGNGGGVCTSGSGAGCIDPDQLVQTMLMRWGNYDTVNNAVRFVNAEVPSGTSPYANAVPGNQNLPASFYLASRPNSWWGLHTAPWPPIVTGGNISNAGGHANKIPAQLCYENTTNYTMFNMATCYIGLSQVTGDVKGSSWC